MLAPGGVGMSRVRLPCWAWAGVFALAGYLSLWALVWVVGR